MVLSGTKLIRKSQLNLHNNCCMHGLCLGLVYLSYVTVRRLSLFSYFNNSRRQDTNNAGTILCSMFLVLFCLVLNLGLWIRCDRVLLVVFSVQTILSSGKVVLVTIGQKDVSSTSHLFLIFISD